MTSSPTTDVFSRTILWANTAADLMMPNPVSLEADATVKEAIAFLTDKGYGAAPVIDNAGRPVGVLSRSDLLAYDREKIDYVPQSADFYAGDELATPAGESIRSGFQVERVDRTQVREIMTPVVYSVAPETPAEDVIRIMLARKVHRLFVVDEDGILAGVISTFDVLRHLRREPA